MAIGLDVALSHIDVGELERDVGIGLIIGVLGNILEFVIAEFAEGKSVALKKSCFFLQKLLFLIDDRVASIFTKGRLFPFLTLIFLIHFSNLPTWCCQTGRKTRLLFTRKIFIECLDSSLRKGHIFGLHSDVKG